MKIKSHDNTRKSIKYEKVHIKIRCFMKRNYLFFKTFKVVFGHFTGSFKIRKLFLSFFTLDWLELEWVFSVQKLIQALEIHKARLFRS